MNKKTLDVFIIGAGPIGLACGIEAEKHNLSYLISDKGMLVNSIYNYPRGMTFFSTSEKLEIGRVPFISHGHKPVRSEALEYYRRVAMSWDLNVSLYNEVLNIDQAGDEYEVSTQKQLYRAKNVVIATGFYDLPHKLNIPGEDLPKVMHYYKEPHPFFNQDLLVIGASNSSVDAALECYRKGARVTMAVRGESIGERVKYWVKPDIENRIKEGSIKAYFNTRVEKIEDHYAVLQTPDGKVRQPNDFVLALTGYEPDFTFLKKTGIEFEDTPAHIPKHDRETMETNQKNIFLAGVICGGMETHKWFIENSRIHARVVMNVIAQRKKAGK